MLRVVCGVTVILLGSQYWLIRLRLVKSEVDILAGVEGGGMRLVPGSFGRFLVLFGLVVEGEREGILVFHLGWE